MAGKFRDIGNFIRSATEIKTTEERYNFPRTEFTRLTDEIRVSSCYRGNLPRHCIHSGKSAGSIVNQDSAFRT